MGIEWSCLCHSFAVATVEDLMATQEPLELKSSRCFEGGSAHEVLDGLWLGDEGSCSDLGVLRRVGITHVIVAGHGLKAHFPTELNYIVLPAWDWDVEDLMRFAIPSILFLLDAKRRGSSILVHCRAGQSRSVTIVTMFIMWSQQWNAASTLGFLKSRRSCIGPNLGFKHQLLTFERLLTMPITQEEEVFCKHSKRIVVEDDLVPKGSLPLDLLWRRMLLASEMVQQRHYRLKIEYEDAGVETFGYIRNAPSSALTSSERKKLRLFACSGCRAHIFDELDQLSTSSTEEPSSDPLTVETCLSSRLADCGSATCMHAGKYFLRLQQWMIQPNRLSQPSSSDILMREKHRGPLLCPGCRAEIGYWDWQEYSTCKACRCFSTPVFCVWKDSVSDSMEGSSSH